MILSGKEIADEVRRGRIQIDGFDPDRVEPNSYGFRLGNTFIEYQDEVLDSYQAPTTVTTVAGPEGVVLKPNTLYLGSTMEGMGSDCFAATLYASRSLSTLGVWIQYSAPLGHCGASFPWTLEIKVSQRTRLYPGMVVGKIAFWAMLGEKTLYDGRYLGSSEAVASRLAIGESARSPITDGAKA